MGVKIFYCYAHEDKKLRVELEKHLRTLEQLMVSPNVKTQNVWK